MTGRCPHRGFVVVCYYDAPYQRTSELRKAKVLWCSECGALACVLADHFPDHDDWTLPRDARTTLTDLRRAP